MFLYDFECLLSVNQFLTFQVFQEPQSSQGLLHIFFLKSGEVGELF